MSWEINPTTTTQEKKNKDTSGAAKGVISTELVSGSLAGGGTREPRKSSIGRLIDLIESSLKESFREPRFRHRHPFWTFEP